MSPTWLSLLTNSIWETTIAAGLSMGLIVAFRELFRGRYRLLNTMVAASFAAYLLHPPIVIALQAAIAAVTLPAFAKFVMVSVLGAGGGLYRWAFGRQGAGYQGCARSDFRQ